MLSIDRRAFHAPLREGVVRRFKALSPPAPEAGGKPRLLLLKGGDVAPVFDTDGEVLLRQEAFFHYVFGGVEEEGFLGAMDLDTGETALFAPRLPESFGVWFGVLQPPSHYKAVYAVDHCAYKDELGGWLASKRPAELHVLAGANTDSGTDSAVLAPPDAEALAQGAGARLVRGGAAFEALVEARVHKSPGEVEVLAYANVAASRAHVSLMRESYRRAALLQQQQQQQKSADSGADGRGADGGKNADGKSADSAAAAPAPAPEGGAEIMREYQLEALFQYETYSASGCRFQGYTPIVAAGPNGAVLHYGHSGAPNRDPVKRGQVVLVDAGCEYYRYTSDITCTWPADGTFTGDQRLVYESVLDAHQRVIGALEPGVSWPEMHTLACRAILSGLTAGGLLRGDVDAMLEAELGGVFMPHGLGHFLGLSTHDVGGYGAYGGGGESGDGGEGGAPATGGAPAAGGGGRRWPARVDRPGYRSLRTARRLEQGMVITVEPGCYFNFEALLDPILLSVGGGGEGEGEGEGAGRGGEGKEGEKKAAAAAAGALRRRQRAFVVPGALERFRGFGGVRLEDNVLITADGCRSLTDVPRAVADVEAVMRGAAWPTKGT